MQHSHNPRAQAGFPAYIDRPGAVIYVACDRPQSDTWQAAVRKEFHPLSVVFVAPDDAALRKGSRKAPDERVLSEEELADWIDDQNRRASVPLVESLRSPMGVIPFIGAGTSGSFKYPLWGPFLVGCAATEEERANVASQIAAGQLEAAAQLLVDRDEEAFYEGVRVAFSRPPSLEAAPDTPLTRLPLLAAGPVITTNFDPVIETVFAAGGRPFESDCLVLGRNDPARVVQALQQNQPVLIKLHGDAAHRDSLTFTALEYERSYGKSRRPGPIEQLATVLYTNRPLLFIGCSLETDRTLQSLKRVHLRNPHLRFHSILAASYRQSTRAARMKSLTGAGIGTLWYRPGRYEEICSILDGLVRQMAVDVFSPARTREVPHSVALPEPLYPGSSPVDPGPSIDAAVGALMQGRLLFFLGAATHPTRMRGNEFYWEICRRAGIPPPPERSNAAQYLADAVDRETLSNSVDEIVRTYLSRPSNVHELLANLPRALRQSGVVAPMVVMTTNWDAVLEPLFAAAGEPLDLFVYNHTGPYKGLFLHRAPDGSEVVVRRPEAYTRVELRGSVLIKMNGGVDDESRWPKSFAVATSDFAELSSRIPQVLPLVLRDLIQPRSFLFWGHGLAEPDVHALMRHLHKLRSASSWAVQLGPNPANIPYWRDVAGVEVVNAELGHYVQRFAAAARARLASAV